MSIRESAVAGSFYTRSAEKLAAEVDAYLGDRGGAARAIGVVTPHAGYMYSGAVAGAVLGRVAVPDSVVVLAPNHRGLGARLALWGEGAWRTPLGEVAVDEDLAAAVLARTDALEADEVAHGPEHSLEVQLPFLQRANPACRIVPVLLGRADAAELETLGAAVAGAIRELGRECLLVASSDMTHYESAESAREKDRLAIDRVLGLDPAGLLEVVGARRITMCGVCPAAAMLWAAKALGAKKADLIRYATSGDVTGDMSEVVGYAGIAVR